MRKLLMVIVLALTMLLAGCDMQMSSAEVVQGPLAGSRIEASFTYDATGTGKMAMVMPDGEVCKGRYFTFSSWTVEDMEFEIALWVRYFGSNFDPFFMQHGKGFLSGDYGRMIVIEYFTGFEGLKTRGYGLGSDNDGNFYRFVF